MRSDRRDVRVVVRDVCSQLQEFGDDLECGRLADIVDVALVGHAEDENVRSADGLPDVVQKDHRAFDNVVRHLVVHIAGEFDESRCEVVLLGLPGQVERIQRDAVPAEPRPGIEGHEPERLRLRGLDDLPHVDLHALAQEGKFVHEGNVDDAERVLEELRHLRDARRGNAEHLAVEHLLVQRGGDRGARRSCSADDLRRVLRLVLRVARIYALGRERDEDVAADDETACFDPRLDDLFGRAGVRRAFEDDELAGMHIRQGFLHDVLDEARVGLLVLVERCRDANGDYVDVGDYGEFDGRAELSGTDDGGQIVRHDVADVVLGAIDLRDALRVSVNADHLVSGLRLLHCKGQADVAESDDGHARRLVANPLHQRVAHPDPPRAARLVVAPARVKITQRHDRITVRSRNRFVGFMGFVGFAQLKKLNELDGFGELNEPALPYSPASSGSLGAWSMGSSSGSSLSDAVCSLSRLAAGKSRPSSEATA